MDSNYNLSRPYLEEPCVRMQMSESLDVTQTCHKLQVMSDWVHVWPEQLIEWVGVCTLSPGATQHQNHMRISSRFIWENGSRQEAVECQEVKYPSHLPKIFSLLSLTDTLSLEGGVRADQLDLTSKSKSSLSSGAIIWTESSPHLHLLSIRLLWFPSSWCKPVLSCSVTPVLFSLHWPCFYIKPGSAV